MQWVNSVCLVFTSVIGPVALHSHLCLNFNFSLIGCSAVALYLSITSPWLWWFVSFQPSGTPGLGGSASRLELRKEKGISNTLQSHSELQLSSSCPKAAGIYVHPTTNPAKVGVNCAILLAIARSNQDRLLPCGLQVSKPWLGLMTVYLYTAQQNERNTLKTH